MSNKFLRALAKVNLVELDEDEEKKVAADSGSDLSMEEIDKILAEEAEREAKSAPKKAKTPPPPPPVAAANAPPSKAGVEEGRAFGEIYQEAAVPEAPYEAEKLLRVLDGLKAMDPATRKAAVLAMDAADEEWTVADAVLDAQRKIQVLESRCEVTSQQLAAIKTQAQQDKAARDQYLAEATATIRKNIEELEATLQREIADIAAQKAAIDGNVEAADGASQRELARLRSEIERLKDIPATFAIERRPE